MKHPFDLLYNAALRADDLPAVKSRRTRRTGGRTNYKCARRPNGTCVSGVLPGSALLRYIAFQHCALCDGCVVALRLTHVSIPVTVTDWTQLPAVLSVSAVGVSGSIGVAFGGTPHTYKTNPVAIWGCPFIFGIVVMKLQLGRR